MHIFILSDQLLDFTHKPSKTLWHLFFFFFGYTRSSLLSGLSLVVPSRLLIVVAALVSENGLYVLNSCGT